MEQKTRVFVGVACYKPYAEFETSLSKFLQDCSLKYDVVCFKVYGKRLVEAQNQISDMFIHSCYENLLMLEDDHWGHTVEMLDDLINSEYDVCGNYYYSRHFPHVIIPMPKYDFDDPTKWLMTTAKPNTKYCDMGLVGFGMTLIRRNVFWKLDKPFFRPNRDKYGKVQYGYATDQDFCLRLHELGLKVGGCFSQCLIHRGLNDTTVVAKRESVSYRNMMTIHASRRIKELNKLKQESRLNG